MKTSGLLFIICGLFSVTQGLKILGIFPSMSKSHNILGDAVMRKFASAGHEVTYITTFPTRKNITNLEEIEIDGLLPKYDAMGLNFLDLEKSSIWVNTAMLYVVGKIQSNHTMSHPRVQKLLSSDAKFDLIFLEIFFTESMLGFGSHFDAPIIGLGTFCANNWNNNLLGNPSQASVIPHPFLSFSDRMSFFQRVYNLAFNVFDNLLLNYFHYPMQKEIFDVAFPSSKHDFHHLVKHGVSFVFLNTHFSIAYPRPYVPNMVEVGGIQVNRNPKPLTGDLKAYLDSAKDGAVYFSMGSNIKATLVPPKVREGILKAFAKFPKVKFMWKWEDSDLPGKPENLFISKWFPQDDLLAHPNIRCFITHGGLLSTTEAIYQGIPIIGVPVFGDQDLNTARAVESGYGLMVKYSNLTEESLTWALGEMLTNDRYKKSAQEISRRYRDQPMEPLDTVLYWTEYVARHKGAPHLKSAAQDLNFLQYHMIDVGLFLVALLIVQVLVIKKTCGALFGKKSRSSTKEKRN